MSIVKVIEVIAESDKSWEHAAQKAATEASDSVRNIKHLYIEHFQAVVEGAKVTKYRVTAKVSFVVDD